MKFKLVINGELHNERHPINVVNVIFVFIRQPVYVKWIDHNFFSGNNLKKCNIDSYLKYLSMQFLQQNSKTEREYETAWANTHWEKTYKCNLCKKLFDEFQMKQY